MRIIIYLMLVLLPATAACENLGEYQDEVYKAPCKVVVEVDACGIKDIGHNLPWLNAILVTSQTDQSLNYVGRIWC